MRSSIPVVLRGLVVGALLVSLLAGSSGAAQESGQLTLVGQSTYVAADGTFDVDLSWSGPVPENLELTFVVYGRLSDEQQLDDPLGAVLNRSGSVAVDSLPVIQRGVRRATLPVRSFSPGDPTRLLLPEAGVYPVVVELRSSDAPVASLTTWLVRLPTEIAETDLLGVATVLRVASADGLEVEEVTALLDAHPTVPVTLHLGSGVLTQLAGDAEATSALRNALDGRAVVSSPRFDLDPSALAGIGRGELYAWGVNQTWDDLRRLGLVPDTTVLPLDTNLTTAGAETLLDLGITTVLNDAPGMATGVLSTPSGSLAVVAADPVLSGELGTDRLAPLRAHRLIARLSLRSEVEPRPVLLDPVTASPTSVDILLGSVDQLGVLGALPVGPDVAPSVPIRPLEQASQALDDVSDRIDGVLAELDTYRSFHLAGGPAPESLEDQLLVMLSRELNPASREDAIGRIEEEIDSAFGAVTLPEGRAVTLAAQHSTIPLSINNRASGGRRVMLEFLSDKIEVASDGQIVELEPGVNSIDIEVETRSLGVSPLEVRLMTPEGRVELASSRFQVRSTAVPGLGLLLSGVAMGLLLAWWGRSWRADRRRRREGPADGQPSSGSNELSGEGAQVGTSA